jgi:hypothetical protein
MDTQQATNYGALLAGMSGIILIIVFACLAFVIFLFWRIFSKAGYPGAMAFLILIPAVGGLIVLCVLAFGQWKVVPLSSVLVAQLPAQLPTRRLTRCLGAPVLRCRKAASHPCRFPETRGAACCDSCPLRPVALRGAVN